MGNLAMAQLLGALRMEGPVRLWLPKNERRWHVLFTVAGKFHNRSTGCETKAEAEKRAAEIFADVVRGPAEAREQVTLQALAAKVDALMSLLTAGGKAEGVSLSPPPLASIPDKLFHDTLQSFLAEKQHVSMWHLRDLKESNAKLIKYLSGIGIFRLRDLTPDHLVNWLRDAGWTGKTYNRRLNSAAAFLNWCKKRGFVLTNPADSIDRVRVPKHSIPETLTLAQCRALMAKVETDHPEWAVYYALALFGGLRADKSEGEIPRLYKQVAEHGWGKFTSEKYMWVPEGKGGSPRKLRMPPNMWAWLSTYCARPQEVPHRCAHTKLAKSIGGLPRNGLRHTAISAYISAGNSMAEAAMTFGNSESIIRKHYADLWTREDAEVFWQIVPSIAAATKGEDRSPIKTESGDRAVA